MNGGFIPEHARDELYCAATQPHEYRIEIPSSNFKRLDHELGRIIVQKSQKRRYDRYTTVELEPHSWPIVQIERVQFAIEWFANTGRFSRSSSDGPQNTVVAVNS